MKKKSKILAAAVMLFAAVSCSKTEEVQPANTNYDAGASPDRPGIPNQKAYYDDDLFTINLFELSDQAAASIIAHNKDFNEIYASEDLDEPQTFRPVIDAIPGPGFNPLWLQFLIVFNPGYTPHQFTSDEDIDAAVQSGEIKLVNTGEIYRCAVVGKK